MRLVPASVTALCCALSFAMLAGCSASFTMPTVDGADAGEMRGMVHGGQQPVVGSHVYVFALGTGGYNTKALSLIKNVAGKTAVDSSGNYYVTTDAQGAFTLTGVYSCTSSMQVYVEAVGGDAGAGANSAIDMMAVLGQCPSANYFGDAIPFLTVNEVTEVVAGFLLAPFHYSGTNTQLSINNTSVAQTGAANAFAMAANLVDIATGTARTTTLNGNGVVPQAMINSLANSIAACVNSTGSGSTACSFTGNTAGFLWKVAQQPWNVDPVATFNLASPTSPFANALSSAPTRYILRVDYFTGTQLTSDGTTALLGSALNPAALSIDQNGNAWVVGKYLHRITPVGGLSTYKTVTFVKPSTVAIEPSSQVIWVADVPAGSSSSYSTNPLYGFNGSGTVGALGYGPYNSSCAATSCQVLAADGAGFIWGNDTTSQMTRINLVGTATRYATTQATQNIIFAADGSPWVSDGSQVQMFQVSGGSYTSAHTYGSGFGTWKTISMRNGETFEPGFPAFASAPAFTNAYVFQFDSTEANFLSMNGFQFAAFQALDSAGTQFVTGLGGIALQVAPVTPTSLSVQAINLDSFAPSGGSAGLVGAPAVDAGGNVWVVENNGNSVAEYIGAAQPVYVPYTPAYSNQRP